MGSTHAVGQSHRKLVAMNGFGMEMYLGYGFDNEEAFDIHCPAPAEFGGRVEEDEDDSGDAGKEEFVAGAAES